MSFNFSPKIVTDGLVLYLDAANTKSFISGSTTWNDISKNKNDGTLINGPTFNPNNMGSIVFDGLNDYVNCGKNSSILFLIRSGLYLHREILNRWFKWYRGKCKS